MAESTESPDRGLDAGISRALRDNLAPLQRSVDEFQHAFADFIASCSSSKPVNTLPAMLRAHWAAAAVASGLNVLSNFVATSLHQQDLDAAVARIRNGEAAVVASGEPVGRAAAQLDPQSTGEPAASFHVPGDVPTPFAPVEAPAHRTQVVETPLFDIAGFIASLPSEQQDLHRRANRVAKVTMQDIKLLKPGDVQQGREQKDLCVRLRSDLDKARREYDRRFKVILEHPVDYFHYWLVEILAEGRSEALGEYPYPSPVLRL